MNCLDCATLGLSSVAVAICVDCGAGVCTDHGNVVPVWLTKTMVINRTVDVEPAERRIYCGTCLSAHEARGDVAATPHGATHEGHRGGHIVKD